MENLHESDNIQKYRYKTLLKTFPIMLLALMGTPKKVSSEKVTSSNFVSYEIEKEKDLHEKIIKESIKKALFTLKDLNSLPLTIKYPENTGLNGPKSIDLSPREVTKPIEKITIILDNRKFEVEPILGVISKIIWTKDALILLLKTKIIETPISYSKEDRLPRLFMELAKTKKGKGEKSGFPGVTVTEI